MNIDFAPLLALVGILLPIGFVYVILFFQSRHLDYGHPKLPATAGNELPHERAELSRAEKIQAVRLMKHWLF
jgi:hypothetical protein